MSNSGEGVAASAQGTVFVVSAPSGAGKTTLCRRLIAELDGIDFSVSFTTRPPRRGEQDGTDYHYVSREEFEKRIAADEFVEWAVVADQQYGTSARAIREAAAGGRDILLDLDTQGAENIRRTIADAILIFILPPGRSALRERLGKRGTDTAEDVERRLGLAADEVRKSPLYDFVVLNDDFETAYDELRSIVVADRSRQIRRARRVREVVLRFDEPP